MSYKLADCETLNQAIQEAIDITSTIGDPQHAQLKGEICAVGNEWLKTLGSHSSLD